MSPVLTMCVEVSVNTLQDVLQVGGLRSQVHGVPRKKLVLASILSDFSRARLGISLSFSFAYFVPPLSEVLEEECNIYELGHRQLQDDQRSGPSIRSMLAVPLRQ